ncbi:MAG TPA: methionine biosynthesis protein MetW [Chloroflexi bacterium]|nr:methionine biosynthesis protein MetW [Chloroflexota bacterium]HHW88603.1 methionine biosynthesis protein MetW [Chloroflexota bacterium]
MSMQSVVSTQSPPLRADLLAIADLIEPGARVLDIGCGDGALLEFLRDRKQVKGRGIELTEAGVLACVRRGLSVRQGNVQEGLADYPDQSFDVVILSQTLPFLDDPAMVLAEMLRVGRTAIVSFSNWGHWRCRLELLFTGRIPVAVDLPQQWYESPRRQPFSVTDFARFCRKIGITIDRQIYLNRGLRVRTGRFKNLLSTTAVFTLQRA